MLFRRRKPADLGERLRIFFWPRRSFWRSARYFSKRALRLTATPHAIAAGIAAGAFASFTPYMGFHFVIAAAVAWVIRGNLIASAIGTAVGNPLSFPFIWASTMALGRFILYGYHPGDIAPLHLGRALWHLDFHEIWQPLLLPMSIGGLILGVVAGLFFYGLTWWTVRTFQAQRRHRLAERARRRALASNVAAAQTA
jgi:uncharacterized protein (DUF2062 family)